MVCLVLRVIPDCLGAWKLVTEGHRGPSFHPECLLLHTLRVSLQHDLIVLMDLPKKCGNIGVITNLVNQRIGEHIYTKV